MTKLLPVLLLGALPALVAAQSDGPFSSVDCIGTAPDAEPGTAAYFARDANNQLCGLRRLGDIAQHPTVALPAVATLLNILPEQSDPWRLPACCDRCSHWMRRRVILIANPTATTGSASASSSTA